MELHSRNFLTNVARLILNGKSASNKWAGSWIQSYRALNP